MKTKHKSCDQPLKIGIEGDQIVIRIGISTLAFCSQEDVGGPLNHKITDEREFARDVAHELQDEDEVGDSMVTNLLERAMRKASENGSTAIEYEPA